MLHVIARSLALVVASALLLSAAPGSETARPGAVTDHVIILSIDGLRPDAIMAYEAENLQRLMDAGSFTLEAQTILPSRTLPSHTSMLTGVLPEVHGVTWNSDRTDELGVVGVPTVFELAHEQGFSTAAFFSKSKFRHLHRPGSLDHVQAPAGRTFLMATRTITDAIVYLQHERPNLLFVHIAEPDYAGHSIGWMSIIYGLGVARADAAVGRLVRAADEVFGPGDYTLIVSADHGGHGREHGSADERDMTIPWIVYGEGVERGARPQRIRTMDTAATALWLLGVVVPDSWSGRPVVESFTWLARYAASLHQPNSTTSPGPIRER